MKYTGLLIVIIALTGCFRLGDNVELSGAKFTGEHLRRISERTGIRFPEGARGIEYFYQGDAIDPSLLAKIEIPNGKKEEFLENEIFRQGRSDGHVSIGAVKKWWQPEKLSQQTYRSLTLGNATSIHCFLGEENGALILYLLWLKV